MNQFSILDNKYNDVLKSLNEIKYRNVNCNEINTSLNFENDANRPNITSNPTDPHPVPVTNKEVKLLQDKVDFLEQSANANVLVCSGPIVQSNENDDQQDNSINERKSRIFDAVKEISPDVGRSNIFNINPIGKDRKLLKITCDSSTTKNKILKNARIEKLPGIYFREYLTSNRNKLFYELRQIKKNHPAKIPLVYTRNGNICYKLENSDKYYLIKDMSDIHELNQNLSNT